MVRSFEALPLKIRRRLALWIFIACGLVFLMVVIGGLTRLTGSGLSMVSWEPVSGIIPPTNDAAWAELFDAYRQTPEFQKINPGMDVHSFKNIFWLEYIHRLLGRAIGLVFLIPFGVFIARRWISQDLLVRLLVMFSLGGLQGLLGWYMVKSGLVDDPHVSPYRLTAHLLLATVVHAYMLWVGLDLWKGRAVSYPQGIRRLSRVALTLVMVTIISGGFVAGTKAGRVYPTFPLMGGNLIPDTYGFLEPGWKNVFENMAAVQFNHRLLATITFLTCGLLAWFGIRTAPRRRTIWVAIGIVTIVQFSIGIATLLLLVPIGLASLHQSGAFILLTMIVIAVHESKTFSQEQAASGR